MPHLKAAQVYVALSAAREPVELEVNETLDIGNLGLFGTGGR